MLISAPVKLASSPARVAAAAARHLIARSHQTINFVHPHRAHSPIASTSGSGGPALVVDADPAAFAHFQFAAPRQLILANTGGKHRISAVSGHRRRSSATQSLLIVDNFRRRLAGMHPDAQIMNFFPQHRRTTVIQLYRHTRFGANSTMGFQPPAASAHWPLQGQAGRRR